MANRTDPSAVTVHGTNPQFLIEKILRQKIYNDPYWKEHCFALTAETVLEKAIELDCIGGAVGGVQRPTPFICLLLKLLQITPEKEIIVEYLKQDDFKYVRALGAIYFRMIGKAVDVYNYLEPLLNDYRRLRQRSDTGYEVVYMDDYVDKLLRDTYVCGVAMPRILKRSMLEDQGLIEPRISALQDELLALEAQESAKSSTAATKKEKERPRNGRSERRRELDSEEDRQREGDRDRRRRREWSRSPRRRYRSRSPDRRRRRSEDRRDRERSDRTDRDERKRGGSRSRSPDRDRRRRRYRSRSRSGSRDRAYDADRRREGESRRSEGRRRSPSRDRERDEERRERRRRSPSPQDEGRRERKGEKKKRSKLFKDDTDKKKPKRTESGGGKTDEQLEIEEQNKLRAQLGLKPLRA